MRHLIGLGVMVALLGLMLPLTAQEVATETTALSTADPLWLESYRAAAIERWESTVSDFEGRNANEVNSDDAILFIGSSSIRRWEDIAVDMAPYRTIERGYGGAKFSDLAIFVKQLIQPHAYRALVIFVGNDVSGKATDHTPDQIEQLVDYIVSVAHQHRPESPVFLIEVTPTESRFAAWPKIRVANARLREIALRTPHTYFIATAEHFLRPDGTPRSELFVSDRLHLNEAGYDLWSSLIRRSLDDIFRLEAKIVHQMRGAAAPAK